MLFQCAEQTLHIFSKPVRAHASEIVLSCLSLHVNVFLIEIMHTFQRDAVTLQPGINKYLYFYPPVNIHCRDVLC